MAPLQIGKLEFLELKKCGIPKIENFIEVQNECFYVV